MNIERAIMELRRSAGLEPAGVSNYVMPALGILAVGILAGAGVALLFAPTTGKRLREDMERKFTDLRSKLMLEAGDMANSHALHRNNVAQPTESSPRG
jgi:YtxH-like protein